MKNPNDKLDIRNPITEYEVNQAQIAQDEAWGSLDIEPDDVPKILTFFPEGFFTAFYDNKGAGNFYTVRLDYDLDNPIKTWTDVSASGTCSTHQPNGKTLYGISLGVSPKFRGMKIGQLLVQRVLDFCVEINCKNFVLGCRVPEYYKHSEIPIEQYITLKNEKGEYQDPELRFYSRCGLYFTKPMPEYMSAENADPESLNYGVMSIWDNPYYKSSAEE